MTDKDRKDDDALEGFFEAARAHPPEVPQGLADRILGDALARQPAPVARRGWLSMLGGLPALGGWVMATCVGFWIGLAPPAALPDLGATLLGMDGTSTLTGTETEGFGWDIGEG